MRRCEQCHDAASSHAWLPYPSRHFQAMNCEACHIPKVFTPARQQTDWTVIQPDGAPVVAYRGADGDPRAPATLLRGFQPVLLPREELDGTRKLTPHNLITTWYWVAGDPPAPVPLDTLRKVFLDGDDFRPEIKTLLDASHDGEVDAAELRLDTTAKADAIAARLAALGLKNPRIVGQIQPYSLHHGVATHSWAVRQCVECHGPASRTDTPIELASYVPGGVLPKMVADANVVWNGRMERTAGGRLVYRPATASVPLYVLGRDRWRLGDTLGMLALAGVMLGVGVHGGLRLLAARKVL